MTTVTGTTHNDTGLQDATSYSYRVRATDAANNLSGYSNIAGAMTLTSGVEPAGWYAGDPHVHRSCGGSPEAVSSLYQKMSSQNLAVISLLADMGNGEVQDPATDLPRVNGQDDPISTTDRIIHWDSEWHWDAIYNQYPHQALGGHIVALGLTEAHQIWEEYTYPILNWAHQQNGIAGFVHMQYLDDGIPQNLTCCTPIEYPVEVALEAADFISEDVNGGESAINAYYRLLNTGFRPSFTAGTDYPCGVSELGSLLTYVQVTGGQMTYGNWIDGIAKGRTVVSRNGHNEFLNLSVNNSATPGDEINLTGGGSVPVTVTWTANQNLTGTIELVQNGVVVASKQASVTSGTSATLSVTVDFTNSGWLAARRMDGSEHQVHTGAVFVTVDSAPVRASVEDAQFYVDWMDNLIEKTSPGGEWDSYFATSLSQVQTRYQAAKAIYQQIALEAAWQATLLTITTISLPGGTQYAPYSATLAASGGLTPYTWSISGGSLPAGLMLNTSTGVIYGTATTAGTFNFTVEVTDSAAATVSKDLSIVVAATPVNQSPILIISSGSNPFSNYYPEILRAEGLNEFDVRDISTVSSADLLSYDIVILGQMSLSSTQATMFSGWVNGGGKLIAMRPDKKLASLLGLSDQSSTSSDRYLLVNTSSGPGAGIVNETIQYHGTADLYNLSGASSLAALYSDATTMTSNPAVTVKAVGGNGGQAAAFVYDLARSVIYTRQGNPAWAGQERDNDPDNLIRSDDLFYPDWIDLDKVAIPQADEQQRLLANLMISMNASKKPLPRFWYLPRGLEAAVVMTGDDHGNNGTAGRFDDYMAMSPSGCSVENWECIRGTSYIYPDTPLSGAEASGYNSAGFEIGAHVSSNCEDWTPSSLEAFFENDLNSWSAVYSALPQPTTSRLHCVAWSDYSTMPLVELNHGIRLDANYYYWPSNWINNRPGMFTGSGMPMRFTDSNGNLIDVYQATTQMTDESGQSYPYTIDSLLDKAIGPEGYYGVFTANIHTDTAESAASDAVVESAVARGIPVISARQMLQWLDGRNASRFSSLSWSGNILSFTISAGSGANGLVAMAPMINGLTINRITYNGSDIPITVDTIKGIQYAFFWAESGDYQVTYALDTVPPTVSGVSPVDGASDISTVTNITVSFSEAMDPSMINSSTFELRTTAYTLVPAVVSYDAATRTATLDPTVTLEISTTYTVTVKGGTNGVKDIADNPLNSDLNWSFTTAAMAGPYTLWPGNTVPGVVDAGPDSAVELGVKFSSDSDGYITGIRFYKAITNTGTHVANLWTNTGTLLATETFTEETASGWQQVNFSSPVAITANTVYVASYRTNVGHYSEDQYFFSDRGVDSQPLHAPADGISGFNGAYGSAGSFPNQGWHSSNYWVDVVFQP